MYPVPRSTTVETPEVLELAKGGASAPAGVRIL